MEGSSTHFLISALDSGNQINASAAVPSGKMSPVSLNRERAENQRGSGHFRDEKAILSLLAIEPSLNRLLYPFFVRHKPLAHTE